MIKKGDLEMDRNRDKIPNKNNSDLSNITQKWVEVLAPFTRDYPLKLSASELARETGIPQQTASRYLDMLSKRGLIEYERRGKNKLFYLDLKKQTTKIVLSIVENQKALHLLSNSEISIILNEILGECDSVIVFGSYSTTRFDKESDLDLVIFECRNKNKIKKIKDRVNIEINEHYITYTGFKKILSLGNALAIEISRSHIMFGQIPKLIEILSGGKIG
mgnify:CR=1 FL=1